MTNTLDTPTPVHEPHEPQRRNPTSIVRVVIAAVAVLALGAVAIAAVARDDGHTGMMTNSQMPESMMGSGQMMNGSMMGHGAPTPTVRGARPISVTATSSRFIPAEIHVRAGEDVTFVLAAADVAHDFIIDELDVHVVAAAGQTGRGGLHAPSTPRRYTAYCSVAGHRAAGMTATVVVDAD
jgi:heme/copper-type cytochrome/quinol oxidase subunit 2